jgi:hypothetical protein
MIPTRLAPARLIAAAAAFLTLAAAIPPAAVAQAPTMIVLRAMPAKTKRGDTFKPLDQITQADIAEVKLGGKTVPITSVDPLLKGPHVLQLMVLLDSMQMAGGNGQFDSLKKFFSDLPPNVEIGVGWLLQGQVRIVQDFTADRDAVGKVLIQQNREQAANPKNDNGNPYQCLRWIGGHWPSYDPAKLRAVLMFTDGIIRSNSQGQAANDMTNPDIEGTSRLLERDGIVPFPFFYLDYPPVDPNRNGGGQLEGQSNYTQLTANTGGEGLWEGQFSPSTFDPLLNKLYSVLRSEVVLTVPAPGAPGKQLSLDVKSTKDDIKLLGPDQITVGNVIKK